MTFKRILLPLDLEQRHQQAIDTAVTLAKQHGAQVLLLHVIELLAGMPFEEERDFYGQLESASRDRLAELDAPFAQQGIAVHRQIVFGSGADSIIEFAGQEQVDLIVMTSPQVDPENPAASAASRCWKVSAMARCPVLLMKLPAG